jgi:hypothetical protein
VHDRQRTRHQPVDADLDVLDLMEVTDVINVEDIIPAEILNDTRVDRAYLEQVFREPQKFLPPRVAERPRDGWETGRPAEPEQAPQEPEGTLARRAKLVALLAAGALVVGSVVAASTLTGTHRAQVSAAADEHGITGAAALGGLAVPGPAAAGSRHSPAKAPSSVKQSQAQQAPSAAQTAGGVGAAAPTTSASAVPSPRAETPATTTSKLQAVRKFYSTVDSNPQGALALLDPLLAGEEPGDLVRVWSSMTSIQLQQAEVQPDGSILAVVMMLEPDGGHLLVKQLLSIADGATGLISQAKLVSSQHL